MSTWIRRKIESSKDFRGAEEFAKEYRPTEGVDYRWVEQHAADEFRMSESRIDTIEAKADSLIKYLGAGSGIVALLLAKAPALQVIPTLVFLLGALFIAILALQPGEHPSLPKTKLAFDYAEQYKPSEATACFAARVSAASAGMAIAARYKAKFVRWAFWLFLAALVWLVGYTVFSTVSFRHLFAWVVSDFFQTSR